MPGLFDGSPLERPVSCERCGAALDECRCPRNAAGKIVLPKDQQPRVSRERRGGGKMVTIISGLDPRASDLPGLLARLKQSLGAGGTIHDDRIELQGDHRDKLVALLKDMGYPAKRSGG